MKAFSKDQIGKGLQLTIATIATMLLFELIFLIPGLETVFLSLIQGNSGWIAWAGLWVVMFLQTSIIPIPGLSILVLTKNLNMVTLNFTNDLLFYAIVLTSYMAGILVAYWIGRKWGKKAVKWVAGSEEEYNKWVSVINKKGKWFYFLTILFPVFPDDLLCLVAGSIKFDLKFFILSNLVARTIGLITTVYVLLSVMSLAGSTVIIIVYALIIAISSILLYKIKKGDK